MIRAKRGVNREYLATFVTPPLDLMMTLIWTSFHSVIQTGVVTTSFRGMTDTEIKRVL